MANQEDIERFLNRLAAEESATISELDPGMWMVKPGGELDFSLVVHHSPPVVIMRVKVMNVPTRDGEMERLSRRLLELNATDLIHGSYGIESDSIVMTEALELSHLDYEEFLAAYESMNVSLASHLRELGSYREAN